MSDFHHQPAVAFQVLRRFMHDTPHEIEAVVAPGERNARLAPVFDRQRAHRCFRHVRGIGHDQVVAPFIDALVQVRWDEIDAFA
jgi:hypothetical protein